MSTNKFPLIYNAYEEDQMNNFGTSNPLNMGKSVLGFASIAAPIMAAGIYGSKRISSNEFKQIAGLKSNAIGSASATVGNNLRRVQEMRNVLQQKNQDAFRKSFLDGNFLDKITTETEAVQRRTLNGIIDALNSSGLETAQIGPLKKQIVELVQSENLKIDTAQKKVLQDTFGMLKDSNPGFFEKMNRSINYYAPVTERLAAPLEFTNNKLNSAFNSVDIGTFGGKAETRFRRVQNALQNSNFSIDAVLAEEKVGKVVSNALYARITDANGRINLMPLDLNDVTNAIGAPLLRVGHGQQSFVAPMAVGNADVVQREFLSKGTTFSTRDIQRSLKSDKKIKAFQSIEDFSISMLEKMAQERGGKFYARDFTELNADLRGISQSLNRTFSEDEFGKLSRDRIKSLGSVIGFHLDGLDPKQMRDFSANVVASQTDMGLLTGHTNLQVSAMNNFRMVNLTMTDGMRIKMDNNIGSTLDPSKSSSFRFSARGLESEFKIGGATVSDVTHAVLPITARPKQFWNNDAFFVKKESHGFGLANKSTDRTLMLLDMKGGRLGLSEGEGYLSTGKFTRKVFPKTVMDPKTMGSAGNELLNELVRRSNQNLGNLVIEKGSVFKFGKETIGIGKAGKGITTYDTIGDFFRAKGSSESGGLFLGKLDNKLIEVPHYRGLRRLELGIVERTTGTGADQFRIVGAADLEDHIPKVFAEHAKVTKKALKRKEDFQNLFGRYKGIDFGHIDIGNVIASKGKVRGKGNKNLITSTIGATEGSMLKKAHYYHATQIASGAEALAAARGMDGAKAAKTILDRAEEIRNTIEVADPKTGAVTQQHTAGSFRKIKSVPEQQKRFMSSFVQSVSEFMGSKEFQKRGQTTAGELGRVFGGFFEAFEATAKAEGKAFSSLTAGEISSIIGGSFSGRGDKFMKSVDAEIEKGLAISLSNLRAGPDIATYRSNPASMEARLFNFLGMKLTQVGGMGADETADFLFSIMSRKSDAGNELIALKEYMRFHEYAKSKESFFDAKMYRDMETVSLEKFTSLEADEMDEFLKSRKSGFLLEFGEGTSASNALNKVFKGKGSLYIPAGPEFMEAIKSQGTEMIKKEGTVQLAGEYKSQMRYFSENLSGFMNSSQMTTEETRKAEVHVRNFQNKMAEISSGAFRNVMKGKLKGSASLRSAGIKVEGVGTDEASRRSAIYGKELADDIVGGKKPMVRDDIKAGAELTSAEQSRVRNMVDITMKKRKGQTVFLETQGFLASMSDFMEGAKDEYMLDDSAPKGVKRKAAYALGKAREDAAGKFQNFFLGGYENYAKSNFSDALTGIVTRHPILSSGHVQTSSLVRYTPETMGGDKYLKNILINQNVEFKEKTLAPLFQAFGSDIFKQGNFEKLSNVAAQGLNAAQQKALTGRHGLFTHMAENIGKFQEGEGGGRMFFPDMEVDVHYGQDKVRRINFSLASAAIGDMDGDLFQLIMPSAKASRTINEKLTGKAAVEAFADEMMYRGSLRMLFDEANVGVKNLAKSMGGSPTDTAKFLKDVGMKEILGKQVGQIDVALDSIRMGMVNMQFGKDELRSVQSGLALLTVLEEVGTIKGKKLPKAFDFAKIITEAANIAYDTGDVSKLRNITENLVFKDTGIAKGFGVRGMDMSAIPNAELRGALESAFKKNKNVLFDLESAFNAIARGAMFGKETGTRYQKTQRGTARVLTNENQSRALDAGWRGAAEKSLTAQMAGESQESIARQTSNFVNEVFSKVSRASGAFDKKMLGPAIAGIAGALGLVGLLGSSGHAPEPMLMPGEVTDQAMGRAIADGRLFDSRGGSTNVSDYRRGSEMSERPINIGQTYVKKDNSYMINGELPNTNAVAKVQQIMNSIGGNANFAINDSRGPISMNFINRSMDQ